MAFCMPVEMWNFIFKTENSLKVRVGDVGGNSLGFFGGLFSPRGQSILAHGCQGAFNQWHFNKVSGERALIKDIGYLLLPDIVLQWTFFFHPFFFTWFFFLSEQIQVIMFFIISLFGFCFLFVFHYQVWQ